MLKAYEDAMAEIRTARTHVARATVNLRKMEELGHAGNDAHHYIEAAMKLLECARAEVRMPEAAKDKIYGKKKIEDGPDCLWNALENAD